MAVQGINKLNQASFFLKHIYLNQFFLSGQINKIEIFLIYKILFKVVEIICGLGKVYAAWNLGGPGVYAAQLTSGHLNNTK